MKPLAGATPPLAALTTIMSADSHPSARSRIGALLLFLVLTVVALIPWWRNHALLRDFYDYGSFVDANARIAQGLRPFADFTTPLQSATFLLNYFSERVGGGTYIGMTWGAAVLIVAGLGVLAFTLARRWTASIAVVIAATIICASASQHTIIIYNPIGVISLALVIWSFASAPLLRREDLSWHVLAALGLFVGGVNKINYHLLACAMAIGWIVYGAVQRRSGIRPVLAALLFVLFFGVLLPMAVELAWTGASLREWYYNVVHLPLQARGGRISYLFSPKLYLQIVHDYYGPMRIRPVGLIGLLVPIVAVIAAWRSSATTVTQRVFLILAALLAALSSTALLLTNNEIAYLALAATLVYGVSLWLGFNIPTRGGWFVGGLCLPALLIGAASWESAWKGQRSQFGHSDAPRSQYIAAENLGPDFAYLRGLRITPTEFHSLAAAASWRALLSEAERAKIFYGPACDWLEHIWPVRKIQHLGLVASAFDSERETALFEREVLSGSGCSYLLVPEAWDYWNESVTRLLGQRFFPERIGSHFFVYRKYPDNVLHSRPLQFLPGIGGNVVSTKLFSTMPLQELSDGRRFVGVDRGSGELNLGVPCNRVGGEAVLKRIPGNQSINVPVRFEAFAAGGEARYSRWKHEAVLAEGQDEVVIPTGELDSSGGSAVFTVAVPEALNGKVFAGWRSPLILHVVDNSTEPPHLQIGAPPFGILDPKTAAGFLPPALQNSAVYFCNAAVINGEINFSRGGEIWIHMKGMVHGIVITGQAKEAGNWHARLHVVHYISGRIEFFHPLGDPDAASTRFEAASTQGEGWLGLLANPDPGTVPFTVKIESAIRN
jgi:hypothetical protein